MSTHTSNQRPNLVTAVAIMTLISGIVNVIWGLIAFLSLLSNLISVVFLPVCMPFTAIPTILGIFEIVYGVKLFSAPPQLIRPSTSIAIFEIASIIYGNIFAMIVGILALVFYNDLIVKAYFEGLLGIKKPASPAGMDSYGPESSVLQPPVSTEPTKEPYEPEPVEPPQQPRKVA